MTTYTWYGAPIHTLSWPSGDWESPANWAPAGGSGTVPGPGDDVILNDANANNHHRSYSVYVSSDVTVASLTISGTASLVLETPNLFYVTNAGGLSIGAGNSLEMQDPGAAIEIAGGQLKNAGAIDGGGIILSGSVKLVGGGTISDTQFTATPGILLANQNETISNSVIGDGTFAFTNGAAGQVNGGLNASIDTGSLSFRNAGTIALLRNDLTIDSDKLTNSGAITVDGDGSGDAVLDFSDSRTLLEGAGTVTLEGGDAYVTGEGGTLTNVDNTISGDGTVGGALPTGNQLAFTNGSAGIVDGTDGNLLTIETTALSNAGLMEATGTGGLSILDMASVANGGTIEALDSGTLTIDDSTIANNHAGIVGALGANSTLSLDDAIITGGLVESVAGSTIAVTGRDNSIDVVWQAMQNAGTITIGPAAALSLGGEIANSGSISITSGSGGDGTLDIDRNGVLLDGGGSVTLADGGVITGQDGSHFDVVENLDNTISGDGWIGNISHNNQLNFVNAPKGTVDATDGSRLTVDTGNNGLENAGLMEATGTGKLTIMDSEAYNFTTIEALDSATLTLADSLIAASSNNAVVEALGANSTLALNDSAIEGGLIEIALGATITVAGDESTIDAFGPAMQNAGTIVLAPDETLTVGGSIVNTGSITITSGTAGDALLQIDDYNLLLSGGGSVVLADGGFITGACGCGIDTITNVDNTISGDGTLGDDGADNQLLFINEKGGTVDAGGTDTLTVTMDGNLFQNYGLMEATDTGNLLILDNSSIDNRGTIEALGSATLTIQDSTITNSPAAVIGALATGSTLVLDGAVISGGLVESVAGSFINLDGLDPSTIDALTHAMQNAGTLAIGDAQALTVGGKIVNAGSISVTSAGDFSVLQIDANNLSLSGGGTLTLASGGIITGADNGGSDMFTNVDNTIGGDGFIGGTPASQLGFANGALGVVDAGGSDTLGLDTGSSSFSNAGLMEATGSGTLLIHSDGAIANSGTVEATGGGTVTSLSDIANRGTLIAQSGSQLTVDGAITGNGDVQINDGGTLEFESAVASTQTITFGTGAHGTLILDDAPDFHGVVAGMTTSGNSAIDFTDIAYGSGTSVHYKPNSAGTGGTITVTDGTTTAAFKVTGSYVAANFTIQDDGSGGTLLKDPPVLSPLPSAPSDLAAPMNFPAAGFGGVACANSDGLTAGFGKSLLDHLGMAL